MSIVKLSNTRKKLKSFGALALTGLIGFMVGTVAMNEYHYRVDSPKIQANGYWEAVWGMSADAADKLKNGDKNQEETLAYLSSKGSHVAYLFRISIGRTKAFKDSHITANKFDQASIDAVDTYQADSLLLEAMDNLSDADLYWILDINTELFDQVRRAENRKSLDDGDYESNTHKYVLMSEIHSSLSELERAKIVDCHKKLTEKLKGNKGEITFGSCSTKSNFKPYEVSPWSRISMFKRWLYSIGL